MAACKENGERKSLGHTRYIYGRVRPGDLIDFCVTSDENEQSRVGGIRVV